MKYCIGLLAAIFLSAISIHAAETNVFFTIYPEGRTGNQNPAPQQQQGGGGWAGGWSMPLLGAAEATGTTTSTNTLLRDGYDRAKFHGITTLWTFNEALLDRPITRVELAKALSSFLKNAIGMTVISHSPCDITKFSDYNKIKEIDRAAVQQTCDRWLIGWKTARTQQLDTYNPAGLVTRSQFASIISRILYGYTYDANPAEALTMFKKAGYIYDISSPSTLERRDTMIIVLRRMAQKRDTKIRTLRPELLGVKPLPESWTWTATPPIQPNPTTWEVVGLTTPEFVEAYNWAKQYNIATDGSYNEASMYAPLRRIDLARMIVLFAENFTGESAHEARNCDITSYKDYAKMSNETISWVQQACNIGVMGLNADRSKLIEFFNPQGLVNRAEFSTVLSRFLYGSKHDNTTKPDNRYVGHIQALKAKGYINKIDTPFMQELNGYVMLIMKRIADKRNSL